MTTLTLSKRSIDLLKNFMAINPSMLFRKGQEQTTISTDSAASVFAKIKLDEEIESEFAIFDLGRFLGVIDSMTEPKIVFGKSNNRCTITGKNGDKTFYKFADPDVLDIPRGIKPPTNSKATFTVTSEMLDKLKRFTSILKTPNISLVAKDGKISLECMDIQKFKKGENTEDHYVINLPGELQELRDFRIILNAEFVSFIMGGSDYEINIYPFKKDDGEMTALVGFTGKDVDYAFAPDISTTIG